MLGQARGASAGRDVRAADYSAGVRLLKKKVFGSWDRFIIPFPPSRGVFMWGHPVWVPSDCTDAALENKRQELEDLLNRLTSDADQFVEHHSSFLTQKSHH